MAALVPVSRLDLTHFTAATLCEGRFEPPPPPPGGGLRYRLLTMTGWGFPAGSSQRESADPGGTAADGC